MANRSSRKTFGTIAREGRAWAVSAQPQVMLRLKRLFPGLVTVQRDYFVPKESMEESVRPRTVVDVCQLQRTKRVARDLEWFMDRYPLDGPKEVLNEIETMAAEARANERAVDRVLGDGYVSPEFKLALPAREYQRHAAALAISSRGLLVADELGLGKTVTAICMLTDPRTRPALVVTMTHLVTQWTSELKRFIPDVNVHVVKSGYVRDLTKPHTREERRRAVDGKLPYPDVIVINYHKLNSWAEALAGVVKGVVFDEAQELRHYDSDKYRAAQAVAWQAEFRMGLSATPIYNFGGEMHSVLSVLTQGEVGTRTEFGAEWCGGDVRIVQRPRELGQYLRLSGLMIRRTRLDVGRELPPLQSVVHHVDANIEALKAVEDRISELAKLILSEKSEDGPTPDQRLQASSEIDWRLRMATGLAKASYVADFVRMVAETEKVVLFGWHRSVYEKWAEELKALNPVFYTGEETAAAKDEAKRKFTQHANCRVMIISLRSGAGLDGLQHVCRTVVFGELDWSPAVHEQCIGRVFRDGQKDPVAAYYMVSEVGADPVMVDVLELKDGQVRGIRDPDEPLVQKQSLDPNRIKRMAADYLKRARGGAT